MTGLLMPKLCQSTSSGRKSKDKETEIDQRLKVGGFQADASTTIGIRQLENL